MLVAGGLQEQRGGVRRAAGDNDDVAPVLLPLAAAVDDDRRHRAPGCIRFQTLDLRVGPQRDVVVLERRAHAAHVRVGLAVGQAGEAVEAVAAHAAPGLRVVLDEVDADR